MTVYLQFLYIYLEHMCVQQLIHILLSLHDDISILAIENVYIDEKVRIYESFINLFSKKSKTQPKKKKCLFWTEKGRNGILFKKS